MPLLGQSKVVILFNDPFKIISSYAYIGVQIALLVKCWIHASQHNL